MENPLLGHEPLPPFARIRPEHVEPGVRELLERSRARIEQLAALERPTFATIVEPLGNCSIGCRERGHPSAT